MRRHRSILGDLRCAIVIALALSSILTFGVLYFIGRTERVNAFEQALCDDLRTISNITEVFPGDDVYVNVEPESLSQYVQGGTRFFQVWDAGEGHELLDRSLSLESLNATLPHPGRLEATPLRFDSTLPDGRRISVLAIQQNAHWGLDEEMLERTRQTIAEHRVDILVSRLSGELDEALAPLAWACLAGSLVLPAVAAAALVWVVPRALRPLQDLGDAVSARGSDDLQPFEAKAAEVVPITQRLNELLQRIGETRKRERRFLADTAHELRTPLAELHTIADVALLESTEGTGHVDALHDMREVTQHMSQLVNALLRLARQGKLEMRETQQERVAVVKVLHQALAARSEALAQRGLQTVWQGDDEIKPETDPTMLRALIDNLIGNAIDHAQAGTIIELRPVADPAGPALHIANLCCDGHEPAHQLHLGRGLALASLYAQVLQVELTTGRRGQRFEAVLRWSASSVGETAVSARAVADDEAGMGRRARGPLVLSETERE